MIMRYIQQSSGLKSVKQDQTTIEILQKADGKRLALHATEVEDIVPRCDSDGRDFLQVNFRSGAKILITDDLIGFKPEARSGLDMEKLPKVVTTPDLVSVFEAIQEALHAEDTKAEEIEILRCVFDSVVRGGEAVGFNLAAEKGWFLRIPTTPRRASA